MTRQYDDFAAAVLGWREANDWSQEDLAREIDVSVATISRWERSKSIPSARQRQRLLASGARLPTRPESETPLAARVAALEQAVSELRDELRAGAVPGRPRSAEEIAASADVLAGIEQHQEPKTGRGRRGKPAP